MSLPHLASGQVASVLPLGVRLTKTPTTAFFKESRLEVMRLVLTAGKHMPAHAVAGPITVQCLEGEVDIGVEGGGGPEVGRRGIGRNGHRAVLIGKGAWNITYLVICRKAETTEFLPGTVEPKAAQSASATVRRVVKGCAPIIRASVRNGKRVMGARLWRARQEGRKT